jgi:hypothetical protein
MQMLKLQSTLAHLFSTCTLGWGTMTFAWPQYNKLTA